MAWDGLKRKVMTAHKTRDNWCAKLERTSVRGIGKFNQGMGDLE